MSDTLFPYFSRRQCQRVVVRILATLALGAGLPSQTGAQQLPRPTATGEPHATAARVASRVTGCIYLDANANGVRDANEPPFPRPVPVMEHYRTQYATAETTTGTYTELLDSGYYLLTLPNAPAYYQLTEGDTGYQGYFTSGTQTDSARSFGLAPVGAVSDVRLTLTPYQEARAGLIQRYRLTLENIGTAPLPTAQLSLSLDGRQTYVSSWPTATRAGQVLSWTLTNLAPFVSQSLEVQASLPINVAAGVQLSLTAQVSGASEVNPANNSAYLPQTVVSTARGSELVVDRSLLSIPQLMAGTPLDYTVHFRNDSPDSTAFVVVRDTLPAHLLQLGTLEVVAQSHPGQWRLTDRGVFEVAMNSARLPSSSVDILRSEGFVRLRVIPPDTLRYGDVIVNQAIVQLGSVGPFATNWVYTVVGGLPTGVSAAADQRWQLTPNPATTDAVLRADLPTAGLVDITVTDVVGRRQLTQRVAAPAGAWAHPLPVAALPAGAYLVRVQAPGLPPHAQRLLRQ